jgi:hypothetical protein
MATQNLYHRIRALPHVQSLEREPDGWCCYLHHGLTTAALGGSGTIIDTSLQRIWGYVKGPASTQKSGSADARIQELTRLIEEKGEDLRKLDHAVQLVHGKGVYKEIKAVEEARYLTAMELKNLMKRKRNLETW